MKAVTSLMFAFLVFTISLTAQSQELEIDPADNQVTVTGFAGDDTSFNGDIRVMLRKAAQPGTPTLHILPSHLQRTDGQAQINRGQVEVGKDIALTANVPTSIPIKITGVTAPGEYKGKLELYFSDRERTTAKTVELVVIAKVRPALTALANADRVKANLVNCKAPCWLATWLLPGSTKKDYELKFEKPIGASQPVVETAMDVKGESNGIQWNANHLQFGQLAVSAETPSPTPTPQPVAQTVQAGGEGVAEKRFLVFPVTLSYSDLPADHYEGSLYLSLDADTPLIKLPVDVNVRVAPLWPFLFLLFGILLGKVVKYMQERGGPAADAQLLFNRVAFRLQEAHPEDQEILAPQMEAADRLINENQPAEATTQLNSINARLTTLQNLRAIEARLAGKEQHDKVREVLEQIKQARERVSQANDEETRILVDAIHNTLVTLVTLMGEAGEEDSEIEGAAGNARRASDASRTAGASAVVQERPLRGNVVTRFFARVSGVVDDFRAETALVLRPLLWFILLFGLIALGMKSLYIDNPTFGASAVDYISLIFWGMSSDVASRALGSLKFE